MGNAAVAHTGRDIVNDSKLYYMKKPEQIVAEIEAMITDSPYKELLNSATESTKKAAEFAEIARIGTIQLIATKLKGIYGLPIIYETP